MKFSVDSLNPAFGNRIRLSVMSALAVRDDIDFNALKEMLGATDGNLATHMAVLERLKYVKIKKKFVGKKTQTSYMMTEPGRRAFGMHVDALEHLLRDLK